MIIYYVSVTNNLKLLEFFLRTLPFFVSEWASDQWHQPYILTAVLVEADRLLVQSTFIRIAHNLKRFLPLKGKVKIQSWKSNKLKFCNSNSHKISAKSYCWISLVYPDSTHSKIHHYYSLYPLFAEFCIDFSEILLWESLHSFPHFSPDFVPKLGEVWPQRVNSIEVRPTSSVCAHDLGFSALALGWPCLGRQDQLARWSTITAQLRLSGSLWTLYTVYRHHKVDDKRAECVGDQRCGHWGHSEDTATHYLSLIIIMLILLASMMHLWWHSAQALSTGQG